MLAAAETPLTLAGFIALASLGIATIGLVVVMLRKSGDNSERLTRLEQKMTDHLNNGSRHGSS